MKRPRNAIWQDPLTRRLAQNTLRAVDAQKHISWNVGSGLIINFMWDEILVPAENQIMDDIQCL